MNIEKAILNTGRIDCRGCKTCATSLEADNLKHAIARLRGVSNVNVDEVTGRVTIEYDTQRIVLSKISERIERLGYRVELVSRKEMP